MVISRRTLAQCRIRISTAAFSPSALSGLSAATGSLLANSLSLFYRHVRISDFYKRHMQSSNSNTSEHMYIFDASVLRTNRQLAADLPIPAIIPQRIVLRQFMMGTAGTGAPMHFHGHAVNELIYGMKHWVLLPPEQGWFSSVPAHSWFPEELSHLRSDRPGETQLLECTQRSGDLLYVPENWGHAIFNLAPSLAVATEFHE
eukprot:m.137929 g.137929  ORF g.137929 m.137929 type:complete len:202 (-) comp9942_c0_seq5:78-683(-)